MEQPTAEQALKKLERNSSNARDRPIASYLGAATGRTR
jgi:hypothetical protein